MAPFKKLRNAVGWFTPDEALELVQKMNPVLPSIVGEHTSTAAGGGIEPLDQNFEAYLRSPGLFNWVSACVDAISNTAASVPIKLMRKRTDGMDEVESHPLLELIADPNPEQGDFSFRYGIAQQMGYTGEAFITTDRETGFDSRFKPGRDEIWVIRSDRMKPVLDKGAIRSGRETNPVSHWIYDGPGGMIRFEVNQVIQIRRPHPTDPFRGLSPLKQLETVLNLEWHALRWNRSYFVGGARPPFALIRSTRPSPEDVERFKEQFHKTYSGSSGGMKPLLLWGDDFQIEQLGDGPGDASFLELLQWTKEAILAVYKCPPFVVALPDGTTWSNSREQTAFFYQMAIRPLMELVLDTLNSSPLVQSFGADLCYVADYSGVEALQPNRKEQMSADVEAVNAGLLTINEVRNMREYGESLEWGDEPPPRWAGSGGLVDLFSEELEAERPDERSASWWDLVRKSKLEKDAAVRRGLRWKAFVQRVAPIERAWSRKIRPLFTEMRDEVLESLDELRDGRLSLSLAPDLEVKKHDDGEPVPQEWSSEQLFDLLKNEKKWAEALEQLAERTLRTGAEDILQEINDLFVPFDLDRPQILEFIRTRLAAQIRTILANRLDEVRAIVTEAAAEGRTIGELEKELRRKFHRESRVWSLRIARTETTGLYNAGAVLGLEDAGIQTKEWLSSRDSDVRESHVSADGQVVPIGSNFVLTNGSGPFPGQIDAASENINCRCTVVSGDF